MDAFQKAPIMKAMLLRKIAPFAKNPKPLDLTELAQPEVEAGQVLLRLSVCGVCHTELDEIEGRTPPPRLPVIPGHQAVGVIEKIGPQLNSDLGRFVTTEVVTTMPSQVDEKRNSDLGRFVTTEVVTTMPSQVDEKRSSDPGRPATTEVVTTGPLKVGDRVGVAWIFSACGKCKFCLSGRENLCSEFRATGRDAPGGYAEYMVALADFVHPIPASLSEAEAAPLLCAGAVGYRALRLANLEDGQILGLSGFGASNHLVLKAARARYPGSKIFVFSRNPQERQLALELGATWSGGFDETPPEKMSAMIDATPVWKPILEGMKHLEPGGRMVINAIRKEELDRQELLKLDYPSQLWLEKEIKSVANVTRQDVREFLQLAAEAGIRPEYQEYELKDANQALQDVKQGKIRGAKVLRVA